LLNDVQEDPPQVTAGVKGLSHTPVNKIPDLRAARTRERLTRRSARDEIDIQTLEEAKQILDPFRLSKVQVEARTWKVGHMRLHGGVVVVSCEHDAVTSLFQTKAESAGSREEIDSDRSPFGLLLGPSSPRLPSWGVRMTLQHERC
jgi:hypothetical protein